MVHLLKVVQETQTPWVKHKVLVITATIHQHIMVVIRVYLVKLHTVVVVVDIHTITMIVNTVVMVVPVVVFPGTVLVVEITLVVRVFLDRVIAVVLQTLVTIPVVAVVPVKLERVQITTHTVVTVYHPIFWERNIGGPVVVVDLDILEMEVTVVKAAVVGVP